MKVCIISLNVVPYFNGDRSRFYGGAEVQSVFVAEALSRCGQQVSLVVADAPNAQLIPYPVENAFDSGAGVRGLRFFYPRWTGIMKALERADADVYYQHCAGMVTGLAAMFCRRKGKVFVYGAGSDTDFSLREVIMAGNTQWRDRLLYMYGLRRAAGVVVQSERQAAMCRVVLGREPRIIPVGIASSKFVPAGEKRPSVLWIGALREVKQPALFLELARRLPEIRFTLVGGPVDSDPGHAARIQEQARSIPNLTLTGRVPQNEVVRLLSEASILVNTSRFEGFPNAFLEAWAAGVPIVSLVDVDGMLAREQVGVVCRDIESLAHEVKSLMEDAARLRAMSESARDLVRRRYGADVLGPQYVQYFDDLLASRR